jgi:CheY-like chemotaxis protein
MPGAPTILICDDEPSLRELMRISLDPGYSFVEAADAAEASELLERVAPDLVLLDVMMPGESGLAVLGRLRETGELRNTPVVIVSAFDTEGDRAAAVEAGATAFVKKPFDPEELGKLVEELLAAGL